MRAKKGDVRGANTLGAETNENTTRRTGDKESGGRDRVSNTAE